MQRKIMGSKSRCGDGCFLLLRYMSSDSTSVRMFLTVNATGMVENDDFDDPRLASYYQKRESIEVIRNLLILPRTSLAGLE